MESIASNSPSSRFRTRVKWTQPVADRMIRAFRDRLALLHRSDPEFFVLGATGNVYTVTLSTTPDCNCPDRNVPCKHILFVLLRVLGVPPDDACLWHRNLRPCQLGRLLNVPTVTDSLAGTRVRERFRQVFPELRQEQSRSSVVLQEASNCPICLEEMKKEEKLVACCICRNPVHEECLSRWRRSRGRRLPTVCVMCRARWKEKEKERYINLSDYIAEEEELPEGDDGGRSCIV